MIDEERLARKFCFVVREWLSATEVDEVIAGTSDVDDYCDCNMAMEEAFQRTFLRSPVMMSEDGMTETEDLALWNRSWDLAREANYKPHTWGPA